MPSGKSKSKQNPDGLRRRSAKTGEELPPKSKRTYVQPIRDPNWFHHGWVRREEKEIEREAK
jgi:hypothetical protein